MIFIVYINENQWIRVQLIGFELLIVNSFFLLLINGILLYVFANDRFS